jgi:NAD-dependent SIR2 family protein deacetylase
MKPDVVFFGESVPREVVERCMEEVIASDLLLVAGSSLAVWSGYRFVKAAHELGKRIVIINAGTTRADELATLKIEADCGDVLSRVAELGG